MTFEQDLIDILTNEIEQLRVDYNEAFIDGKADERAKIVAWLRADLRDTFTAGDLIEAGEHLK